ncbi:unnamed protein product [Calypogeia fissa]
MKEAMADLKKSPSLLLSWKVRNSEKHPNELTLCVSEEFREGGDWALVVDRRETKAELGKLKKTKTKVGRDGWGNDDSLLSGTKGWMSSQLFGRRAIFTMQSAGSKKLPVDDSDDDCVGADSDSATAWNRSNITD